MKQEWLTWNRKERVLNRPLSFLVVLHDNRIKLINTIEVTLWVGGHRDFD